MNSDWLFYYAYRVLLLYFQVHYVAACIREEFTKLIDVTEVRSVRESQLFQVHFNEFPRPSKDTVYFQSKLVSGSGFRSNLDVPQEFKVQSTQFWRK